VSTITDVEAVATPAEADDAAVEEFAGRVFELYTHGMLTFLIDLGHRTGLFEAAAEGPATSEELAARAGLQERYIREWLGGLVTGGIVDYEPSTCTYSLPVVHATCLSGGGRWDLSSLAQLNTNLGNHLHQVATAFREGGGVPYSEFRPELTDLLDANSRVTYGNLLVDAWLPLAPGLTDRLAAGARVADIGCGTGYAVIVLAQAFPASTFVGYDLADDAIRRAEAEATELGLRNARFEVCDAPTLAAREQYDVAFTFDAIHDQADPEGALRRIHEALVPGGTYVMVEPAASSNLEDNMANPIAPWIYGISTLHCMTVSLAEGGTGLGTAWGEQRARAMLTEIGFGEVAVHAAPGDPFDSIFVTTKPVGSSS